MISIRRRVDISSNKCFVKPFKLVEGEHLYVKLIPCAEVTQTPGALLDLVFSDN